ncbi:MAG TPA: DUF484 family protein [Rickettsiales bacterium]|nr:DUF484 family protein [Rickettsiales bacterium]
MAQAKTKDGLTAQKVAEYLRDHPNFFRDHADLLEAISPPEVQHGGNVVDIQHHMLGKLQQGLQNIRNQYDYLVTSSRDNMSTLHQVHEAVLAVIRAPDLERLLEVLTMDLPAFFNVDVVRLGIESEAAEFFETRFGMQNSSGISFLEMGMIDIALGKNKPSLLIADTRKHPGYGLDQIFPDCDDLVESAVLMRLRLPSSGRPALLAFGIRVKDHFHTGQGTEMLSFLSQIVEHRLDERLNESGIAEMI